MTSFSSQGATVEKVLINVEAQNSRVRKLIDQRFAYVAVSRAESDAKVYTDDAQRLAQTMQRTIDKYQAMDTSQQTPASSYASVPHQNRFGTGIAQL